MASMPIPGSLAVRDTILYRALRLAQVTRGPGQTASPEQFTDALISLNGLIDSLNIQPDAIFSVDQQRFTLTPAKFVYTIGQDPTLALTADFDAPRPISIDNARLVLTSSPTAVYLPLKLATAAEWADLRLREIWSAIPQVLYCDYGFPLAGLHFWPAPSQANDLELWTWHVVPVLETPDDQVILPTGYADMYTYQLAVRLADQFGTALPPNVLTTANKLLGRVKALNNAPAAMGTADAGTSGAKGGYFNYLTGGAG